MRRRLWCAKYALALLTSAAVTFHLLYAPPDAGHDVGTQWTRDLETPREPDVKTPESLVLIEKDVLYGVETVSKLDVKRASVGKFRKSDVEHDVKTLRRRTPSKPNVEIRVETPTTSDIEFKRFKTIKENGANVDMPNKLDVNNSIEAHRKPGKDIYAERFRIPNVAAYHETSQIQNSVLGEPDVETSPKKNINLLRRIAHGNVNVSTGYTVLPGNVTVHVGNVRVPFDVKFLDAASGVCGDFDVARTSLVVFVASSVGHFEKRQAVRETWGLRMLQVSSNFRVVFLLGKAPGQEIQEAVQQEIYRHGDIVQLDLEESFRNLGLKSVAGLKWSRDFCPDADLVMKTDDDILVHVPNLLDASEEGRRRTDDLLLCHENRRRQILRKELLDRTDLPDSYHKYQVTEDELPGTYYPPYCSGMAYVFSASVRDRLLDACSKTPVFFIEDVHVTGFCRHKSGVGIRPHPGISLRPPIQTSCSFKGDDRRITSQELDVQGLRLLWNEVNSRGFFCPQLLGLRRNNAAHTKTPPEMNVTRVVLNPDT